MGADTSTLKGAGAKPQFSWLSNLSPGYIKKLKERFEYQSDDFTLDRQALKNTFKCNDRECDIIFEHFDMDGNGKVDSYEFTCALAMLSHATLEEKAELVFGIYDFDGNKYITRDELVILMTNVLSSLKAMNKQPPPSIAEIEAKTDDFFKKADTDADKKITLTEFKAYVSKDKQILEALLNAQVTNREELGTDFGSGDTGVPDIEPDLENECCPKELQKPVRKQNIKDGVEDEDGFEVETAGEGDQFMSVKPWKGVVKNTVPSTYKPNKRDTEAPEGTLQLEYVHGYRCHDARNNVRYTATGKVIYHAAALGIVLNQKTNTQQFFNQHSDDLHCMAVDPTGQFCATGQIGAKPLIFVWNTETMEVVARIAGPLLKGIKNLAFSPDGNYLAATAFDEDHCVAVYQWKAKLKAGETLKPISSGKGTRAAILSLGFSPDSRTVVATAVKEIDFFTFDTPVIKGKKGTGLTGTNVSSILCQAFVGTTLYTGMFNGSVASWNGTAVKGFMKAHTDGCHAMAARPAGKGLITGGGDGIIILWGSSPAGLAEERRIDLKAPEIRSMMPKVRSVVENAQGFVLVGTRGGEIVEFNNNPKPSVFMRGHYEGELWGLATHPTKEEYITVGQDNFLAIWDIKQRKQKKFGKLEQAANVAEYSHDGNLLAIGYVNGAVHVLQLNNNFALKANKKDRDKPISEIKFSPNDAIMAVGAHDSCIITYDAVNNFKPMKRIRGHTSTVTHFDFSLDGNVIMSNCTSYNILFFDASTGKHITHCSQFKDEKWSTWTCTLGWSVEGIWPPCANGTDINAVDRSPENLCIATADDFGMVKLFRYPCPVEKVTAFNQYNGHSSHVTNVRFLKGSNYVISTGGNDKCIFQWKYLANKAAAEEAKHAATEQVDFSSIADDFDLEPPQPEEKKSTKPARKVIQDNDDDFEVEDAGAGDQALSIKPFEGDMKASTPAQYKKALPPTMADKPSGNLSIKYAHGFRSFDTRNNLKYIDNTNIAYSTAGLGVVLNKDANTQRFFTGHEEDVVSLCIHPERNIIATGQMAAKGKAKAIDIFVWDIKTMEVLAQLNNFHRGAIRKLEFSPDGNKLLTIGEDPQNSVAIYDWAAKRIICKSGVDPDKVFDSAWKNDTEFATVGLKHVKFFTIDGTNLRVEKGIYGAAGIVPFISCHFGFAEKKFFTGSAQGVLFDWAGKSAGKQYKGVHTDALWSILTVEKGNALLTGGNDGKVILWDKMMRPYKTIDLAMVTTFPTGVRSLDFNEANGYILVGTKGAEIIELQGSKFKVLMQGHFEGVKKAELWGCAVHPTEQLFATCGADKTVRLWQEDKMVKCSSLGAFEFDLTSIDWSSNGAFLAVGDRNDTIFTLDAKTLTILASATGAFANQAAKHKEPWIEDLKISPDSTMIAFGSHGGVSQVDLFKVMENGKKLQSIGPVKVGSTSAITHLDWSLDSRSIVVNTQAYELKFANVQTKATSSASGFTSTEWKTMTCTFGWQVKGIWPGVDYTDVNSTCRSNDQTVLATADDFGQVKLFKYPCVFDKPQYNSYKGHSSHVTKVKFSKGDRYLVSTGGNDKTVIIWQTDFGEAGAQPQGRGGAGAAGAQPPQQFKMNTNFEDDDGDFAVSCKDQAVVAKQEIKKQKTIKKPVVEEDDDGFEKEDVGHGDESISVKMWVKQSKAPTTFKKPKVNGKAAPSVKMELEWVHGYRSRDSRNNIGIMLDESIVYHAAAVGINYNPQTGQQHFFDKHDDDIAAIAYSSDKMTIATGQIGPLAGIYVWNGVDQTLIGKLPAKLKKGIQALSFSPSGKILAAVAVDVDHCVALYNIQSMTFIAMQTGDKAAILDIAMKDDTTFATSGVQHFKVWTNGAGLTKKDGSFGTFDPRHAVCKYSDESCLTGAITGELYVWSGNAIKQAIPLHEQLIDSIEVTSSNVFTGGKDMKVCVLSKTFQNLWSFSINTPQFNSVCGRVRAVAINDAMNKIYVGTMGCEIYEVPINMAQKKIGAPKTLVQGHWSIPAMPTTEIWGMTVHPNKKDIITCSDDGTLRIWDIVNKKQKAIVSLVVDDQGNPLGEEDLKKGPPLNCQARSIEISPDLKHLAVGFKGGNVKILNAQDLSTIKTLHVSKDGWICDIKYSTDGQYVAFGSHDKHCYIYDVKKGYTLHKDLNKSSSAVLHIDWGTGSNKHAIHISDQAGEILYYNAATGAQDPSGVNSYQNEPWATFSTHLSWATNGIWVTSDYSNVNCVDRSIWTHTEDYQLLASGDDDGKVKIFRYPSTEEGSQFVQGNGHSSHVTQVRFSLQNGAIFSAGGNDGCIFQWKCTANV